MQHVKELGVRKCLVSCGIYSLSILLLFHILWIWAVFVICVCICASLCMRASVNDACKKNSVRSLVAFINYQYPLLYLHKCPLCVCVCVLIRS